MKIHRGPIATLAALALSLAGGAAGQGLNGGEVTGPVGSLTKRPKILQVPTGYTALATCVQNAAPGSVLIVQPGSYACIDVQKPLAILGQAGVTLVGPSTIQGLAGPNDVVIVDTTFTTLSIQSAPGAVLLDGCTFLGDTQAEAALSITASPDVRLQYCDFQNLLPQPTSQHGIASAASRVEVSSSFLAGAAGFDGTGPDDAGPGGYGILAAASSRVHLAACQGLGGLGGETEGYGFRGGSGGALFRIEDAGEAIVNGPGALTGGDGSRTLFGFDGRGGNGISLFQDGQPKILRIGETQIAGGIGGASAADGDSIGPVTAQVQIVQPPFDDPTLEVIGVPFYCGPSPTLRVRGAPGSPVLLSIGADPIVAPAPPAAVELLVLPTQTMNGVIGPSGYADFVFNTTYFAPGTVHVVQAEVQGPGGLERTNSGLLIQR